MRPIQVLRLPRLRLNRACRAGVPPAPRARQRELSRAGVPPAQRARQRELSVGFPHEGRRDSCPAFGRRGLHIYLTCALFALALAIPAAANDFLTTLTLKSDGGCVLRSDSTQPRLTLEQQVRMQKRMTKASEGGLDIDDPPTLSPVEKDPKPFTDAELGKLLREMIEEQQEQRAQPGEIKIESIDISSNTVRVVTTHSFVSLEDLLRNPYLLWGQSGLAFESLRFEKDSEGRLRLTLTPYSANSRWKKNVKQTWKASKVSAELRFVLPGKVLTSGLPNTEGNATWIAFDSKKDETLELAAKLYDAPTVITAELGGLKLDTPLDSKTLVRQGGRSGSGPDLPITDAGPGFSAEPMSVTVTTLHWFPDGQKLLKNADSTFGRQPAGAVVQAKFFAPKGRTLQSVGGVRVLKAVDDKGRPIVAGIEGDAASQEVTTFTSGRGGSQVNSGQIQLRLPLPAADAQSIEHLDAEAIAITVGNWKELTVPAAAVTSTNEIDLASVLPGAKLIIAKITSKNRQQTVQARFTGPPAIRQLELQARDGGAPNSNSWMNERDFKNKGAESTRSFILQTYRMSDDGQPLEGAPSLVVRFPEDQKRERVRFSLKGLDLL